MKDDVAKDAVVARSVAGPYVCVMGSKADSVKTEVCSFRGGESILTDGSWDGDRRDHEGRLGL